MRVVLAVALVLITFSGCVIKPAGEPFVVPEGAGFLLLKLEADKTVAWTLDPAQDTGSGDRVALTSGNGALQRYVSHAQGQRAQAGTSFVLAEGLPSDAWINVTAAVQGTIFVTNTIGSASNAKAPEDLRLRTELWVAGEFGGAREYDYTLASSGQAPDEWLPVPIYFRPEVRSLPAGAPVEIRIIPLFGTNDLIIGTGGDHQSFLAIPVLPRDPLGSVLYLENGVLVTSPTQGNGTERAGTDGLDIATDVVPRDPWEASGTSAAEDAFGPDGAPGPTNPYDVMQAAQGTDAEHDRSAPLALLGMAMLGFFGLAWRGPRRPTLAVLLVAAVALAGCGKPAADEDPDQAGDPTIQPKVDEKVEDYDGDPEAALGAINGTVTDHLGIPIGGAHVSLIGTNRFTSSGPDGRFQLLDLDPGTFSLRVTAPDKDALERSVTVTGGKVNVLDIRLAPEAGRQADDIAHDHDEWRGATRKLLATGALEAWTHGYLVDQPAGPPVCGPSYGDSSAGDDGVYGPEDAAAGTTSAENNCDYPVDLGIDSRIIPGTITVEVILDWDADADGAPQRLGVMYANAKQDLLMLQKNRYAPREPGEATMIQIMPDEADPGHQKFTNWQFWVEVPIGDLSSTQATHYVIPDVSIEVYGHKGIVPYEPAHRDFWGDATELVLFDGWATSHSTTTGTLPSATHYYQPDVLVPVGTKRIEGTMSWEQTTLGDAPAIDYGLAYKPADVASAQWEAGLIPIDGSTSGRTFTFSFEPEDQDDLDQYYQTDSNFRFYITATGDDVTAYRGTVTFTLDAIAYR